MKRSKEIKRPINSLILLLVTTQTKEENRWANQTITQVGYVLEVILLGMAKSVLTKGKRFNLYYAHHYSSFER